LGLNGKYPPLLVIGVLTVILAAPRGASAQGSWTDWWWSGGIHAAHGTGVYSVDNTTLGGQINLQPSPAVLLSAGVARVIDNDAVPEASVTGTHGFFLTRVSPFQPVWHVGLGIVMIAEAFVRPREAFGDLRSDREGFGTLLTTGLRFPIGRVRPFAEIRYAALFQRDSAEWSIAAGVDVWAVPMF